MAEAVAAELNYPGAATLKKVLRQRGIPFEDAEIDAMIATDATRQVQRSKYDFKGKIVSTGLNKRWFCDLIDFTATPSDGGKSVGLGPTEDRERYVLVCQDVYSRMLYTEALTNKSPNAVISAFRKIMDRAGVRPERVMIDLGAEFKDFAELEGISVTTKRKEDINGLATLDVAIGRLKKALARVARRRRTDDWASILEEVTKGQNSIPNESYLEGKAPNQVAGDQELQKKLYEKNREYATHNAKRTEARAEKIEETQRFRVMTSAGGRFTRGFKPKWSDEIHTAAEVDGAFVTDEQGREYMTKFVQPVPETSEELPARRMERGGSDVVEQRRRRVLRDLARNVASYIGQERMTVMRLAGYLRPRGFKQLALEARINMRTPVINFLRVFPELFAIERVDGVSYVQTIAAEPAFPGARRLRRARLL